MDDPDFAARLFEVRRHAQALLVEPLSKEQLTELGCELQDLESVLIQRLTDMGLMWTLRKES